MVVDESIENEHSRLGVKALGLIHWVIVVVVLGVSQLPEGITKSQSSFYFKTYACVSAYMTVAEQLRSCCCCCWGFTVFTEGIFVPVVVLEKCPIISADLTVTA